MDMHKEELDKLANALNNGDVEITAVNITEVGISKEKAKEALSVFKADLESAKDLRRRLDSKIQTWKREYSGEPYGNEEEGKSALVSRDIKRVSEWQHAGLVEPFISTPDIIKANPVTWEDREIAPKIEILLNTQFCRQFNRYNFMNKAVRVLDQEGTCIVRLGWEYEERTYEEVVLVDVPNPELEQVNQQLQQLQMYAQQLQQGAGQPVNSDEIAMQIQQDPEFQAMAERDPEVAQQVLEERVMQAQQQQGNTQGIEQEMQAIQQQMEQLQQAMQQIPPTIKQKQIQAVTKPIKNQPTAMVCRSEDVFIDPTCQDDMDKCQFVIYRYETNLSALRQDGSFVNLDQIVAEMNDNDYDEPDKTYFRFKDEPRKKLIVYEYWGNYDMNGDGITEPIVCSWVNDTIIKCEENPFPDKKPPFLVTPFSPIPFTLYGESNAELLSVPQKIKTSILRGFVDSLSQAHNGQLVTSKELFDNINLKKFLKGESAIANRPITGGDIYQGRFTEFPSSAYNILQLMDAESESITGVKNFGQGLNTTGLGNIATGVQNVIDASAGRKLNIVRNISENLVKPLLRKWLAYDAVFLDEEAQFRITNEEFFVLRRDDLGANIDIDLSISTSEDNKATASELAFLLQTLGPSNPEISKMLLVSICELYKRPELAKSIKDYQPQPDPLQQKMQELQIQLLEAQVRRENAKAGEDEVDVGLKQAKTETEKAKAKNLTAQADKTDLDYIQQHDGTKFNQNMELQANKNNFQINRELLKLLNQTNNGKSYL